MDGWIEGRKEGRMELIEEWTHGLMESWLGGWTDREVG